MITPILERAILQGKAVNRSHAFGFSSLGIIKVPDHKICIIVDFTYYHFLPRWKNDQKPASALPDFTFLEIDSKKSVNHYIFRNYFVSKMQEAVLIHENFGTVSKYDTYIISDSNIQIRLSLMSQFSVASLTQMSPPITEQEQNQPLGYGDSKVVTKFTFPITGEQYAPQSSELSGDGDRDQAYNNFNPINNIVFAPSPEIPMEAQIPVINFNCIYLDQDFSEYLQPNK